MGYIAENMKTGANPPVDEWPFTLLRLVPAQFAHWKHRAITQGKKMDALFSKLWNEFIERKNRGRTTNCLFDKSLDDAGSKDVSTLGSWQWGLHSVQFLGGEILEGGAATTSSTHISFVMAMACYPEAQAKAQGHIDAAVGNERTPQWEYLRQDSVPCSDPEGDCPLAMRYGHWHSPHRPRGGLLQRISVPQRSPHSAEYLMSSPKTSTVPYG